MTNTLNKETVSKPKMRGWLHAGAAPVALLAGIILVLVAPPAYRLAIAIYVLCTVILFSTSAVYHRGNWKPRTKAILQRADHSAIFLLIAGTYTPVAVILVHGTQQTTMLLLAWAGAGIGISLRMLPKAPLWLFVAAYLLLGLAAAMYTPTILQNGGVLILGLIITGGILYITGSVVFSLQRPNPSIRWFAFHEIFHSFTLGAWAAQYIGILLAAVGTAAVVTS